MCMNVDKYRELGFNDFIIDHLKNYDAKHVLGYRCTPPLYVESSPLAERDIFPLWECGVTVTYFNNEIKKFEICNLENIEDVWARYSSVQGVLAHFVLDLMEDENTDEEILRIGEAVGFKAIQALLAEANSAEDYSSWREEYPRQYS